MRALVMAAGLGNRLRPLTDTLPKPLVPVLGRPMVEYVLETLAKGGVVEAMINIHHLPNKMREFVNVWNGRGGVPFLRIQDESAEILDSGGAIAMAGSWLFESDQSALVCNSDVLGSPDLHSLSACHEKLFKSLGVECTLSALKHPEAGAKFTGLRRQEDLITAFERPTRAESDLWLFPGYYMIQASVLKRLPPAGTPFSIVEFLWKPLMSEKKLGAWTYPGPYYDLGTIADLKIAEEELAKH